jgi:hypothetical protein
MMAFPTVGWSHDDLVPVCVIDTLLGGGASFSAGGPGKGMYSRLYREVLNEKPWVENVNAFSTQLYDVGLVGVYGSAMPEHAGDLASLMAAHLARLVEEPVAGPELSRARNQLASSVLMNLETRGLLCEDIGRQILGHGKRLDPAELCRRIQAVTPGDLQRVMRAALAHPPAFAAVGDVATVPDYASIHKFFADRMAAHRATGAGAGIPRVFMRGGAGSRGMTIGQSGLHSGGALAPGAPAAAAGVQGPATPGHGHGSFRSLHTGRQAGPAARCELR